MRDFYPTLIAENLGKQGISARAAFVPLDKFTSRRDANTIHLAQAFDQPQRRRCWRSAGPPRPSRRAHRPARHPRPGRPCNRPVRPASHRRRPRLRYRPCRPACPARLYRALRSRLRQYGVRIEAAWRLSASPAAEAHPLGRDRNQRLALRHHAGAYLLATGGILGGGFSSDAAGRFWKSCSTFRSAAPPDRSQCSAAISSTRASRSSRPVWKSTTATGPSTQTGSPSTTTCGRRAGCSPMPTAARTQLGRTVHCRRSRRGLALTRSAARLPAQT